jgi:hypothetical protein
MPFYTLPRYFRESVLGSYTPIEGAPADCFVYTRQFGGQRRLITLNFSSNEQQLQLPITSPARILLSTHLDREEPVDLTSLCLRSNEGCIIDQLQFSG